MRTQKIDLNNLDKSSWKKFRFDEIAKTVSERVDPNNTELKIYIGLEHLDPENIHIKRRGTPADVKGQKLKCYPGDIIFGKRRAYQKKAAIVDFEGICSAHAFVLRANPDIIEPKLFPFFLHSDLFMHKAIDISVGGLSPTINWKHLKEQAFFLPPKKEQAQLAKLLWAMDNVVEKEVDVLERLQQFYLVKIEKELIKKNDTKLYFNNLGEIIRGVGYKPNDLLEYYNEESCIILRSNNISNSKLNFKDIKILSVEKVKAVQFLRSNDFAICMSNGSKELVGKNARFYPTGKNVSIGSFCAGFRPKNDISAELTEHLFASKSYRQTIKRILSGSTINNLKPSDIENIFFRVNNNNNEVQQLLITLRKLADGIKEIKDKISTSKDLLKSLINEVF